MTAEAAQFPAHRSQRSPRLTFWGAVRSEWVKLISLRSHWVIAILLFLVSAGIPILLMSLLTIWSPSTRAEAVEIITVAQTFTLLLGAVLGILSIGGELSTGTIRASVVAVPRRGMFVAAKGLLIAVTVGAVTALGTLVAAFGVTFIAAAAGGQLTIGSDLLPRLALEVLSAALFALFAFGTTLLVRSSSGAITIVVVMMFVLPVVLSIVSGILQAEWPATLSMYLPSSTASLMVTWSNDPSQLPWWAATLVLAGWAAAPVAAGTALFARRDL
ncbi:MAG: ABC transporter permease [Microbacteriaceae bacterium]|nr:ABC transporter permease [Microbacteriaceae bacterium]